VHTDWIVVVPFRVSGAKSRFGPGDHGELALAMALDTVDAALTVARVIVVTDAPEHFSHGGIRVIADPGAGLNAAIEAGLEQAGTSSDRAVLLADHPLLTAGELEDALLAARVHPLAFVADADSSGSALTTAQRGIPHAPAFGAHSRAAHLAAGYVELEGDWPGLRRDIDTADQLSGVIRPGRHTRVVLSRYS
jgi:2-phospho-L-lactate/phosphoenolpyruvate guanylyltransferase